jgi:hypothetical protein
VLPSEVLLGRERIVRPAPELKVLQRRRSAERVGMAMMDLESRRLAASLACRRDLFRTIDSPTLESFVSRSVRMAAIEYSSLRPSSRRDVLNVGTRD